MAIENTKVEDLWISARALRALILSCFASRVAYWLALREGRDFDCPSLVCVFIVGPAPTRNTGSKVMFCRFQRDAYNCGVARDPDSLRARRGESGG